MIWILALPLEIAAGVFAVLGWVLNRPDSAKRCFRRFAAFGLIFAVSVLWLVARIQEHNWWQVALDLAALALFWYPGSVRWYRRLEAARRAERLFVAEFFARPRS